MKGKKLLFLSVLLVGMLVFYQGVFAPRATTAESDDNYGTIKVSGEAAISAEPDQASVVLAVETQEETANKAVEENARLVDQVLEALIEYGLEEEQMETGSYRVHSYRDQSPARNETEEVRITYRAYNQVNLTLDNLHEVGKMIDLAITAGANQVQSLHFEVRDPQELNLQALQKATEQARSKGDAIARGAGVNIKGIKSITEERTSYAPYRSEVAMEDTAEEAAPTTPIIPGEVEVNATVVVEYIF